MDRFFYCADMDTGSINKMEDICRQQSCSHSRRNSSSDMEACAISIQFCWPHFKGNCTLNIVNIHFMVERTTIAFTGAIQLAYNRGQHTYWQLGNQKCACCTSTTSRTHHTKFLQVEQTHPRHCILQKVHTQLQTFQGQQAINYPLHTRSWPGSDLLCEDGTTDFLCTRNEGPDGTTTGYNQQFSKITASIYR